MAQKELRDGVSCGKMTDGKTPGTITKATLRMSPLEFGY
jgi:hypothetical protein